MRETESKRGRTVWLAGTLAAMLLAGTGVFAFAQGARVDAQLRDFEGKLFPNVVVIMKHEETGTTHEARTDRNGRFTQLGLRAGVYTLTFRANDEDFYTMQLRLSATSEERLDLNFKEISAKEKSGEAEEARRKREEERKKFEAMKIHFDAGRAALDRGKQMRNEAARAPADQRQAIEQQMAGLFQSAVTEFEQAQQSAPEKEQNLHVIHANLGEAYESAGRVQDAVGAYQKAIALRPSASYYNNLGNNLAKLGKIPEAGEAYGKAMELEPANAAVYWRNFGIVLYNSNRLKEAIEPFRKATELDPKNPDAWYLLGSSLIAVMESRMEGDKIIAIVPEGTAEAFLKYLEVAPDGRFAQAARDSLVQLEALGVGIQTRIRQPRKRP